MRQLRKQHLLLFRLLNDRFLFLNRRQVERILTLAPRSANKALARLLAERYLERRYRTDSFEHFQTPLYYLGARGWRMLGNSADAYKAYQAKIEARSGPELGHLLAVYDVLLKFILEADLKRIIGGEDRFWQESFSFGNIPDAWIEYKGGEAFIEVDRGTESIEVVAKKFENYIKFKQAGSFGIMFPGCRFRVLFITSTEKRIEALETVTRSDDIWYATMEEFLTQPLNHEHWFAHEGFYALPVAPKEKM